MTSLKRAFSEVVLASAALPLSAYSVLSAHPVTQHLTQRLPHLAGARTFERELLLPPGVNDYAVRRGHAIIVDAADDHANLADLAERDGEIVRALA